MDRNFQTAIGMYERSAALFARRAGTDSLHFPAGFVPAWAEQAEHLALAGERLGDDGALQPLQSVLGHLFGQAKAGYYAAQPISIDAALPLAEPPTDGAEQLQRLWAAFAAQQKQIGDFGAPLPVQEANYLALLQRYCWAIPAPLVAGQPGDVSLYDYARVSAALAVCMTGASDAQPALLVGGDVSGVQDWLYALSSSGVAKGLRGRSFYLQLLAEVIAYYVLERLGLPSCNLLYAGGGNFYLLAPVGSESRLAAIQQDISRKLLRMHEGALYVALGHASITQAMLNGQGDTIGSAWDAVNRVLNINKARRFSELDNAAMAEAIGSPLAGTGELKDTCAVCRRTIESKEKGKSLDEGRRQCDLCTSFEELGNQLRRAEYLAISRIAPAETGTTSGWQPGLAQFGYDVQLLENANDAKAGWQVQPSELVRIYYWKSEPDISNFPGWPGEQRTVWAFRPLAQCTPINSEREIATFDELSSEGIERWGVLRMDVDNLGTIFQKGIPNSSLSRVVGLSGLLRLYFEGHVPRLAEKYNRDASGSQRPRMYLMYAGGDDLFIVGGWSDLPDLARDIREDFRRFACANPKVTISGGISLALDKKYPLYQAARLAGDAEHQAKHQRGDEKNALSFLGEVMGWGGEFERVRSRVEDLKRWLGDGEGKLPRSFLMTLRSIDAEWREWKKRETGASRRYQHTDKTFYLGPWQWHLVYSLARAGERTKDTHIKEEVRDFAESIVGAEIHWLGLTARWTELATRKNDPRDKK